MQARVTAILVAHNGAQWLPRTLAAVQDQTRQPDSLIAVVTASSDASARLVAEAQPTHILDTQSRLSFGTAVTHALGALPPVADEDEWLWLLAHDTAPEVGALAALLAAVEVNPSVGVAGPKLMDWENPAFIREFGESMTRFGASYQLAEHELDQAQHDRMSDVLAVGAGGMLVRRSLWEQLGGFDPALPTADNGLDFCVRVRLAGPRVIAVPDARVATGGSGYSGPGYSGKGSVRRRRRTSRRAAQLHRRLVYSPAFALPFHWLSLVPLAILRGLFRLVRKQPGAVAGELAAAFKAAFSGRVGEARRKLRASSRTGWKALAGLRVPGDEVRRRRALQREIAQQRARGEREPAQFVSTGGLTTVLLAAVAGLVVFLPLFGSSLISGGALLPLSSRVGELWAHVGHGWRDIGLGFVGSADPFTYVLAVLGTLTFWSPSFALVLLYFVALPLAALTAWFCAARFTERPWARTVAAVLWVLAPPFLSALNYGELGPMLVHILLPWLVLAGTNARSSWSSAALAGLLFAAITACAPSLWPLLTLVWVAATIAAGRNAFRLIAIPVPALVLFAPLIVSQFRAGNPLGLMADPGAPTAHSNPTVLDLLVGLPTSGSAGWLAVSPVTDLGADIVTIALVVLVIPVILMALASVVIAPGAGSATALLLAAAGFVTAIATSHLAIQLAGPDAITLWAGTGLSVYWFGLVAGTMLTLSALPRAVPVLALVGTVAVGVMVLPLLAAMLVGSSPARPPANTAQLPAYVTAEAANTARVGTLLLSVDSHGNVVADVEHGRGPTLDNQSTLQSTRTELTGPEQELAVVVGDLSSTSSGATAVPALSGLGIEFIVVKPSQGDDATQNAVVGQLTNALDSNAQLIPVGETLFGDLWQVAEPGIAALPEPSPTNIGTATGVLILVAQGMVFLVAILLALPAGRLEAAPEPRPTRRRGKVAKETVPADQSRAVVTATEHTNPTAESSPSTVELAEQKIAETTLDAYAAPDEEVEALSTGTEEDERV